MSRIMDRRGVSLPLVIILLAILASGVALGFTRVSSERRIIGDQQAQLEAWSSAQAGLEQYAASLSGAPPVSDSVAISLGSRDTAFVRLQQLRPRVGTSAAIYLVRSRGRSRSAERYDVRTPPAERTVAQLAVHPALTMDVDAAWTSIAGLNKNGGSGTLSGTDRCGAQPPVAGVGVPATAAGGGPGYEQNGGASVPTGSPPIQDMGPDPAAAAENVDIDWDAIVNGGALPPDFEFNGNAGWPSSAQFADWPIVRINGDRSLGPTDDGRGILVVTGNLSLSGTFVWEGVMLVGGAITSDGYNNVYGATVSGLNVQLGMTVPESDIGNGNKVFQYDSCSIDNALSNAYSLRLLQNAWVDNWPEF